jgi:hypothetical protein
MRTDVDPALRAKVQRYVFWIPLIFLFFLAVASVARGQAIPFKWHDHATIAGGLSQQIDLVWEIDTSKGSVPDFHEIIGAWLERPSQNKRWVVKKEDVTRSPGSATSYQKLTTKIRLPGSGHFSFQLRNCMNAVPPATEPSCGAWANSLDPTISRVNGQSRSWWAYGYLEPAGPITPL